LHCREPFLQESNLGVARLPFLRLTILEAGESPFEELHQLGQLVATLAILIRDVVG
jgi:hypothetical protein